jgi:quinol monooxygenase YgiN
MSQEDSIVVKKAIWVMLKAKPGKEAEVEAFLSQGALLAKEEPLTVNWYGVKMAPGVYGVFDTFAAEEGRDAHLSGEIAKALMANAPDLFSNEIRIEKMDVLASK